MSKIIGNTTATPNPRPDWNQPDSTKADYIKNKPKLGTLAAKDNVAKSDLAADVQASLGKADSALQSYTETDPTVPSHVKSITTTDISNWDAKAEISDIPTKTSQLTNNSDFATNTSVDTKIANLVDSAPEALNTLGELAVALKEHEDAYDALLETVGKKVDKVEGKGLSTNDFTTAEKTKLAGIAEGANNYTLPSAGTTLGGVKTGGDVTISDGVITINDDSHNHTISNVDNLQSELDTKVNSSTSQTDNSIAYTKNVPTNSASYAKVTKIGGMTRKCTNLTTAQAVYEGAHAYLETVVDGRNCIRFTSGENIYKKPITFKPNTQYTASFYAKGEDSNGATTGNVAFAFFYKDGSNSVVYVGINAPWQLVTITSDSGKTVTSIGVVAMEYRAYVYLDTDTFMLNEGSTALPYEPYFEGLRSAPVSELVSEGANIIPFPYEDGMSKTINGITFTVNNDGGITVNGTAAGNAVFIIKGNSGRYVKLSELLGAPEGQYTFSGTRMDGFYMDILSKVGANIVVGQTFNTENYSTQVFSTIRMVVVSGKTINNETVYPMLNKGSTALPYRPYFKRTLPIPEEVRPAHGINENIYDYIEWCEDGTRKKRAKCGLVDMGTLNWVYGSGVFFVELDKKYGFANLLCGAYPNDPVYWQDASDKSMTGSYTSSYVYVKDSAYTDVATFKTAMSGVMLIYELAEPEVTDISDILPDNNAIGVEGDGSITPVNEFGYAVPTEITYYSDSNNDIISANEFVGNLIGTADRAKYAENAESHINNKSNPHEVTAEQIGALSTSGGTITGDIMLEAPATGTPSIIFKRGTDSDNYTDWRIRDKDGILHFGKRLNADAFTDVVSFDDDGAITAPEFKGNLSGTADIANYAEAATYIKCYRAGAYDNKTVADLRADLKTWLKTAKEGARFHFEGNRLWIDLWNSGDTTSIIQPGVQWVVERRDGYQNNPDNADMYATLQISCYGSYSEYFVGLNNGEWTKVKENITSGNIGSQSVQSATSATTATKATQDGNGNIIADTYVKKESGKGLSTNDFTDTDKSKLNNAMPNNEPVVKYTAQTLTEAQKAQVRSNIGAGASSFSGNYNDLSNKPDIPDALADLTSDSTHRTVTDAEKATWNAKSNFSGNYNDLTNKPTIPTVNNATLTIQKNGSNVATFTANSSTNATANISVPTKTSEITNDSGFITSSSIPTSLKNPTALTFGTKSYDGSSAKEITAADLGLSGAMKFLGTSSTAISDGSTTKTITVNGSSVTVAAGNVVLYNGNEFVWDGTKWEELGHEGSFKVKQTAVASPSANGSTTAFIDTISQDANGNITATKKNITDATTSAKGVVQLTDSTSSTSTTTAATPKSVKSAYDLANTAKTNAATAQTKADSAYDLASSKLTKNVTDLGNMSGKTVAQLQAALDGWLDTCYNIPNSRATFSCNTGWLSLWNSGSTATISAGATWTVELDTWYSSSAYVLLKVTQYYDKEVYYIARNNDTWSSTVRHVAFTDDTVARANSIYQSGIDWGGNNIVGGITPIGAALSSEHSANRLAYLNPNALSFEYSDNGGTSWTAMNVADSTKIGFVTTSEAFYVGNATNVTTNHRTRVTLTAQDGTNGYIYTRPRKLLLNVSNPHGLAVTLETKTGGSGANWSTVGTYALSGWSGWNDIPLTFSTLGGGADQKSNVWYMRLTFAITSVNSSYAAQKSSIIGMRLFGDTCWTRTSNMGETGHLYSYDTSQNATFPANVTASTFIGTLSGNASSASKVNNVIPEWTGSIDNADTNWLAAWTTDGTKIKAIDKRTLSVGSASTAAKVLDSGNGNNITFNYSAEGVIDPDWIAAWNGYELRAVRTYSLKVDSASTAGSATKATQDGSGNVITSTYATKSSLATVATSGSYNDLSNKPTIPAAYSHPSTHPASMITGLATVATSGKYSDLSGTPTSMTPTAHNQASNTINAMTGYSKPSSTGAIATSDTLNAAIGKLEKALDGKQASGSYSTTGHKHTKSEITDFPTLATVATSGSYNDLSNKPSIPTVNNGTLTIQKNGTTVNSFSANSSSNITANITVPTKVSELTNDSGFINGIPYGTTAPKANGTASAGSANSVSRSDHVHPLQTSVSGSSGSCTGNAASATTATKWNGYSMSVVTSKPSSFDSNTIYFITE